MSSVTPSIYNISIVVSSTSVSVSIAFLPVTTLKRMRRLGSYNVVPGTVYCATFERGVKPFSVASVRSSPFTAPYSSRTSDVVTLTITPLLAIHNYDLYCYVESSAGVGNTLGQVLVTRKSFRTGCCQSVTYTNAPVSVIGDVTTYGTGSATSYIFTYELGAAPSANDVTVVPKLIYTGGGSAPGYAVTVTPPSTTFGSAAKGAMLSGNFYLTFLGPITVVYQVNLVVSGPQAFEFAQNTSTVVTIIGGGQAPAVPQLSSAQFSVTGQYVTVSFDSATNQAGITANTFACTGLFKFKGAALSTCLWLDSQNVKVVLQSITPATNQSTVLDVGDTVTIRGGLIKAVCRTGTNCAAYKALGSARRKLLVTSPSTPGAAKKRGATAVGAQGASDVLSITVSEPSTALVPNVTLTLPSTIGACANLTVDVSTSTGSGGRPWESVVFKVVPASGSLTPNANTMKIENYLNNNFNPVSAVVSVPAALIYPSSYQVIVTMTNFLGGAATATSTFSVSGDRNRPLVTILGPPTVTTTAKSALSLPGVATLSSCGTGSLSLNYTWFFSIVTPLGPSTINNKTQGKEPTTFYLPAYSLFAGRMYQAKLAVYVQDAKFNRLSSSFATASVFVGHGAIVSQIRGNGGSASRQVPVDQPFVIDGSLSYDEDFAPGRTLLSFSWACTIASTNGFGSPCSFSSVVAAQTGSVFTMPANTMAAGVTYSFALSVTSADGLRTSSSSVMVLAKSAGVPQLTISNGNAKFNVDAQLNVLATITANATIDATWSVFTGASTPFSLQNAQTTPNRVFGRKSAAPGVAFPLSFPYYTFTPGQSYNFVLTAFASPDRTQSATTQITLLANVAPYGGYLTVSPSKGTALSTNFRLQTAGWASDNSPLQYQFYYQQVVSTLVPPLLVRGTSLLPYTTTNLPAGLLSRGYNLTIVAFCVDPYVSVGNTSHVVQVINNAGTQASAYLKSALASSLASGNPDSTYQAINLASSSLSTVDCSKTPPAYCKSLNRDVCVTSSNTCGSCLAGYKGISGGSNAPCKSATAKAGAVGEACTADGDCLYNLCGTTPPRQCAAPSVVCESSAVDGAVLPCSGHGTCQFFDTSGNQISECLITNPLCKAQCSCVTGYGGVDCALNAKALADASSSRVTMCTALLSGALATSA